MRKFYCQSIRVWMLILLAGMLPQFLSAQLPMTRSVFSGTYSPISVGTGATLSTITGDDGTQTLIPIGFTFNYLGNNFTTVDACANGWVSFAAAGANAWTNANLFTATTPNNTLAPWFDDLNVGTGSVLYQTQGTTPNQTFTVQWTDVLSYNGATSTINFQVVLYETTNVIEYHYGTVTGAGTATAESASIGLEGATGGSGNFLDAISGSAFVNNSFMNTTKWPVAFLRFTPGLPTPIPGGTYTVGSTGMMPSLSEAIAMINHQGILGPVTLSLTDASYDAPLNVFPIMLGPVAGNSSTNTITIQPASGTSSLNYTGVLGGTGGNMGNATAFGTTTEAIMYVIGTDYVTMRNLNFVGSGASPVVDRGLYVANASSTNGSQNGLYEGISVSLIRSLTSTIGIQQNVVTAPTAASGANSNNIYRDLSITNSYSGVYLLGNATFPDLTCQIGNTSPTAFNMIGNPSTANDLGGASAATQGYGIRTGNQSGSKVFNNAVSNVGTTGITDGILCELSQGTTEIFMNKVTGVRNASTTSASNACGIRANVATTTGHSLRVYNNFVSDITSGYTGAATATRIVKGIFVQAAGGGVVGSNINVDANSVRLDGGTSNYSNSCFEIGTTSGPVINTRNNIFANFTGAQTSPATHTAWRSTATASVGNTGSASNYNDLYVPNATSGYVGQGNLTNYATLGDWQTAMVGQDANSVSADPVFTSATNLHASALALNAVANLGGSAWVTVDIDNEARTGTPDIGADEYVLLAIDASPLAVVSPLAGNCYSATEAVVAQVRNAGVSPLDFTVNPCTVTVNITGAITATLTYIVNDNSLNGGSPLAAGSTINVPVGTANMSTAGTYTFNVSVVCTGDLNSANDAMSSAHTVTFSAGTASASSMNVCDGDSVTLSIAGNNGTMLQWETSLDGGLSWNPLAGGTTDPFTFLPTDTLLYRALVCGLIYSAYDTLNLVPVFPPTVQGDTICGADTAFLVATGPGVMQWYDSLTGGSLLATGATFAVTPTVTTTYYAAMWNGGQPGSHLTTMIAGNGSSGNVFAVKALNTIEINGFNIHCSSAAGTLTNWEIYYRPDDYLLTPGSQNSSVGWDTLGIVTGVPSAGPGNETVIPIALSLTQPGGAKWSYMVCATSGSVSYTNGTVTGALYNSNADLEVYQGHGGTLFNLPNNPRVFNGRIRYSVGCPSSRVAVTAVVNTAASITATPTSAVLCQGDSLAISVSSTNAGYQYTWTPSSSLNSSTGTNVTATPLSTTSYLVTASDSLGCVAYDTVDVQVNLTPLTTITSSSDTICIGDTVTINGFAGPMFFQDTTDVFIPSNTTQTSVINTSGVASTTVAQVCINMTHTWDSDMNITLISPMGTTLDLTSGNGGSGDNYLGTCFNMSAGTNITAGVAPFTGTFVPEGAGGFNVFNGQNMNGVWTLQMEDVVGGDDGNLLDWSIEFAGVGATYSWSSTPAGFIDSTATITVAPLVTTTYHLLLTDSLTGCDTTFDYTLVVRAQLAASIVAPAVVCNGDSLTLTANVSGGDGFYGYNWAGLSTADSLDVVVSSDTTFALEVFDGCGDVVNDTVTILLAQAMNVGISGDTTICFGDTLSLNANVTGGDGNYTYVWSPNLSSTSMLVDVPTASGPYSVTVSDGCGTTPAVASHSVTVTPLPVAAFTFTGASLAYNFTNGSTDASTYAWDFGDGSTSTAASPSYTYAADGVYQVCLVASSSCGSDTICQSVTVVSNSKPFGEGVVQLWPNPARGQFNVRVEGLQGDHLSMELYDLAGQRVMKLDYSQVAVTMTETLRADLPAGTYYLRVNDGVNNATLRVVLE